MDAHGGNVRASRARLLSLATAMAVALPAVGAVGISPVAAQDGKFCSGTNIVFFPGGTEGGGFETVVYNGASTILSGKICGSTAPSRQPCSSADWSVWSGR